MKFTRFFGIFPMLFALVLLFYCCKDDPVTGDGGDDKPTNPQQPPSSGGVDPTNPANPPPNNNLGGATFNAGTWVTNMEIISNPTVTTVYEGTEVDIAGLGVRLTYKDGSIFEKAVTRNEFIITPPSYIGPSSDHELKYIGEFYPNQPKKTFKSPSSMFKISSVNLSSYPLKALINYFEGYGYEHSGISPITGYYITGQSSSVSSGSPVYTDILTPKTLYLNFTTNASSSRKVDLKFGESSFNTWFAARDVDNYYELNRVYVNNAIFSKQITFDDPRAFASNIGDKENFWISHLSDARIGLTYKGVASLQKEVKLIDAAMGTVPRTSFAITSYPEGWNRQIQYSSNPASSSSYDSSYYLTSYVGSVPSRKLSVEYGMNNGNKSSDSFNVPVYDTIKGVSIESNGKINLNAAKSDNMETFLKQVRVYAVYQMGNNKNDAVRKQIYVGPAFNVFNDLYINGTANNNVNRSEGGILNSTNSKKGSAKAQVTFITWDGNILSAQKNNNSDRTEYDKNLYLPIVSTGTIEVGVAGY